MAHNVDIEKIETIIFRVTEENGIFSPGPQTPLSFQSIVAVEALMEIEDQYDIEVPDELFQKCTTVRDFSELALTHINKS